MNKVQQQPQIANEHNLWKKNSCETLFSLWNIFKKFASQLNLPKLYKFLYTKLTALDVCCCARPCEEGKLKITREFLYLINFDTMSKCLQNIVALKKTFAQSLRPFCW